MLCIPAWSEKRTWDCIPGFQGALMAMEEHRREKTLERSADEGEENEAEWAKEDEYWEYGDGED